MFNFNPFRPRTQSASSHGRGRHIPVSRFVVDEFATNPEPRCPCMLLVDTSDSMKGEPIRQLNEGLRTFAADLREDSLAAKRVEIGLIRFGPVEIINDFQTADHFVAPTLTARSNTPMGEAIDLGISMLETRKSHYRNTDTPYYRPWIFLISDGEPSDMISAAIEKVRFGEAKKAFSFFAVGVDGANLRTLSEIAVRSPLRLRDLRFGEMFLWLSNSLKSVSQSRITEDVQLVNPAIPTGWGSV